MLELFTKGCQTFIQLVEVPKEKGVSYSISELIRESLTTFILGGSKDAQRCVDPQRSVES